MTLCLSSALSTSTVSHADSSLAQERQEGGGQTYPMFRSYPSMDLQYSKGHIMD